VCLLCGTDWILIYNSTFCPHSVFTCFVWMWEQTAIISVYSINWLVFITETECVYCAVRTGYLHMRQVKLSLQRITQNPPCTPLPTPHTCINSSHWHLCLVLFSADQQNFYILYVKSHIARIWSNAHPDGSLTLLRWPWTARGSYYVTRTHPYS